MFARYIATAVSLKGELITRVQLTPCDEQDRSLAIKHAEKYLSTNSDGLSVVIYEASVHVGVPPVAASTVRAIDYGDVEDALGIQEKARK